MDSPMTTTANIPELPPPTSTPTEWSEVERPLLLQLAGMGWMVVAGDTDVPDLTERERFTQTILRDRLAAAIRKINADDGPVDDLTIERAIRRLTEVPAGQPLLQRNRTLTERLIVGVAVDPPEASAGSRQRTIRFIDFDTLANNDFLAINQFRVEPLGYSGGITGPSACIPDVVLFVNGLPLVVIECKSPSITDPMEEGLNQVLRYSSNRPWLGEDEGVPDLFLFNQLIVVSDYYHAQMGALGALQEHYGGWKDTAPVPLRRSPRNSTRSRRRSSPRNC